MASLTSVTTPIYNAPAIDEFRTWKQRLAPNPQEAGFDP